MAKLKKRSCQYCKNKISWIDYKDAANLRKHLGTWSKMKSGHETGTCTKHQRQVAEAIKRARFLAILPYTTR